MRAAMHQTLAGEHPEIKQVFLPSRSLELSKWGQQCSSVMMEMHNGVQRGLKDSVGRPSLEETDRASEMKDAL